MFFLAAGIKKTPPKLAASFLRLELSVTKTLDDKHQKETTAHLQSTAPSLHSSWMYLEAVSGRLTAANRRSESAREMTNIVVACARSFGHLSSATTVRRLPGMGGRWKIGYGLVILIVTLENM